MANSEEDWIKDLGPLPPAPTEQCKLIGIDHIPTTYKVVETMFATLPDGTSLFLRPGTLIRQREVVDRPDFGPCGPLLEARRHIAEIAPSEKTPACKHERRAQEVAHKAMVLLDRALEALGCAVKTDGLRRGEDPVMTKREQIKIAASAVVLLQRAMADKDFARFKAVHTDENFVLHRGETVMTVVSKMTKVVEDTLPKPLAHCVLHSNFTASDWAEIFEIAEG